MQGTYARLVEMAATRAIEREDLMAELELAEQNLTKVDQDALDMHGELQVANAMIQDLEALVALAAVKEVPRAPDIFIAPSDGEGVSGGLASVVEACAHISERGVNRGRPCIRPRENEERTHAKGRHRY